MSNLTDNLTDFNTLAPVFEETLYIEIESYNASFVFKVARTVQIQRLSLWQQRELLYI